MSRSYSQAIDSLRTPASKILVVRALQPGDLLCAVPALRGLRHWQPTAHITLCGLPWAEQFVQRFAHLLDDFQLFPGYHGIPERPFDDRAWGQWGAHCAAHGYDLAIQLHGSGTYINEFIRQTKASVTAGFHPVDQPELALDFTLPWPEQGHEIERLKSLVLHLGASDCGDHLELPLRQCERVAAQKLLMAAGWEKGRPYICMHVGGRALSRRWPLENYIAVARQFLQAGWVIVLTGVGEEAELAATLNGQVAHKCIDLTGRTSFGELVALIDAAEVLLSNDTSVSHVAAARRVPSVVIVLGSDPERWFPLDRKLHRLLMVDVPCRPCGPTACAIGFPCAGGVTVPMVIRAIYEQLSGTRRPSDFPTRPLQVHICPDQNRQSASYDRCGPAL